MTCRGTRFSAGTSTMYSGAFASGRVGESLVLGSQIGGRARGRAEIRSLSNVEQRLQTRAPEAGDERLPLRHAHESASAARDGVDEQHDRERHADPPRQRPSGRAGAPDDPERGVRPANRRQRADHMARREQRGHQVGIESRPVPAFTNRLQRRKRQEQTERNRVDAADDQAQQHARGDRHSEPESSAAGRRRRHRSRR